LVNTNAPVQASNSNRSARTLVNTNAPVGASSIG
jgi:hypothetical protein